MKSLLPFSSFIKLKYLYITIDLFSLTLFILIFYILFILVRKNRILNKRRSINLILEEWITEIILEERKVNQVFDVPEKIQQLLKQKLAKEVLLQELIKLKKSLSGVPGNNAQKLYEQLRLDQLSRQRLSSKRWHIKAQGIQELAIMNQHSNSSDILRLTNNKHPMLRMEAQTALVRLQKYKGLNFFNTLTYPLSEWHQVNLLQLLSNLPVTHVHGISDWLQSCISSVVQFALKLIGEQHAEEFCDEVIKCLGDFDIGVRRCAILCLGEILLGYAIEALKKHFPKEENKELQLCIISQLQKTGAQSEIKFLIDLQLIEDSDIKLASENTILYLLKNKKSFVAA